MNNLEVELLQIKLEQDWTEADQHPEFCYLYQYLMQFVFLGKELEKHNFLRNMVD